MIDAEAMPLLKRCSLAGHAELKTRNELFSRHPLAADMLIDILVRLPSFVQVHMQCTAGHGSCGMKHRSQAACSRLLPCSVSQIACVCLR